MTTNTPIEKPIEIVVYVPISTYNPIVVPDQLSGFKLVDAGMVKLADT